MASKENRTYRSRRPAKTVVTVILILLAALLIITVAIFFGFRRYIVYTDEGVHLEVPWLDYNGSDSGAGSE